MSPRRAAVARAYAVPLVLAAAMFSPALWFPHWLWDPALYSAISIRAARTGQWWTLYHSNVTYFNKPPLWFWIHAAFVRILGDARWVLRLPDVLAGMGCVAATVSIVLRFHGPRVAMLAGIGLALCSEYVRRMSQFRLDIAHAMFMLIALRMVIAGVRPRPRGTIPGQAVLRRWWIIVAGLPIGVAMLTKPIFGLLVLLLVGAWMALSGRASRRAIPWLLGSAAAAVAVAAPWHLSMWLIHGEAFINAYFVRESMQRATGARFNPEPWYAYLLYLSGIETGVGRRMGGGSVGWPYVPLALCAVMGMAWWVLGRRLARRLSTEGGRLVQVWTLGLLVALSAFGDKKSWYLAPVFPGLAWIGALWLERVMPRPVRRGIWRIAPAAAAITLATVLIVRPSFERRQGGEAVMPTIDAFIRDHPGAEYWNGSLHHYDNATIYLRTGVWPRFARDDNTGRRWTPGAGSYLLFDLRRGSPDPTDREIAADGRFRLVERTRSDAAPPTADTAPGR